jgi:hypothetical protein
MRSGFIRFSVAAFRGVPLRAQWLDGAPMLPAAAQLYNRVDTLGWDRPMTDSMPQRVPHALTVRVSRSRSCRCQLLQFFLFEEFNLNAG